MTLEEEKLFDEIKFADTGHYAYKYKQRRQEIKDFINRLLNSRHDQWSQSIKEEVEGMFMAHGIKLPNHPHVDDMNFFNYTPTGIYNKALQDVLTILNKQEDE
jgi:hypothetical protein